MVEAPDGKKVERQYLKDLCPSNKCVDTLGHTGEMLEQKCGWYKLEDVYYKSCILHTECGQKAAVSGKDDISWTCLAMRNLMGIAIFASFISLMSLWYENEIKQQYIHPE